MMSFRKSNTLAPISSYRTPIDPYVSDVVNGFFQLSGKSLENEQRQWCSFLKNNSKQAWLRCIDDESSTSPSRSPPYPCGKLDEPSNHPYDEL